MKYADIHSHILFDVDDGSRNIEESIMLLKAMKDIGFDNIILTIWLHAFLFEFVIKTFVTGIEIIKIKPIITITTNISTKVKPLFFIIPPYTLYIIFKYY